MSRVTGNAENCNVFFPKLPLELKALPQWVLWRYEDRGDGPTKVPYRVKTPKIKASATNPATWATWDDALQALEAGAGDGLGFVFSKDDPFSGVDLDKMRDPETGELTPEARAIVDALDGYTEISPSGAGVHIIVRGSLPIAGKRRGWIEAYSYGRYFTVTGDALEPVHKEIPERGEALETLYRERLQAPTEFEEIEDDTPIPAAPTTNSIGPGPTDAAILERLQADRDGEPARLLAGDWQGRYPSHSEADFKLLQRIAFYTQDPDQIERVWMGSGLARDKSRRRADYRRGSINEALKTPGERFDWSQRIIPPWAKRPTTGAETNGAEDPEPDAPEPEDTPEPERKEYPRADAGNAERLVDAYGDRIRWVWEWKKWIVWDGKRWDQNSGTALVRMARATARSIHHDAAHEPDASRQKDIFKWAIQSQNEGRINAMISLARADLEISAADLDTDPWLLNVQNGTVDLQTGELRPHSREDLLTKIAPVPYDSNAQAPRFHEFLKETLGADDLIAFVRRLAGYSLTGKTSERCFAILHGSGKNGKSTFVELIQFVLGDYSRNTATETILTKRFEGVGNDIAALQGARFVSAAEVETGRRLAESKVKNLTGSDTVTARFLYGEPFDYRPQFKLWLSTNNKPEIRGTDNAIWDRIKLIPFTQRFDGSKGDPKLPEKLQAEASGVLAWMVAGCAEWVQDGLGTATAVDLATEGYREEMDVLGAFLNERCIVGDGESVPLSELFREYEFWSVQAGETALSKQKFGAALTDRGIESKNLTGNVAHRMGVSLREREEAPTGGGFRA